MMNTLYSTRRWLIASWRSLAAEGSHTKISIGAILILMGAVRIFTQQSQLFSDNFQGISGDALLLLTAFLLVLVIFFVSDAAKSTSVPTSYEIVCDVLRSNLKLDAEVAIKLHGVVEDTEYSALKIISEVRQMYDTANTLVTFMDQSSVTFDALDREAINTINHLRGVENFVLKLPAQMKKDLDNVQLISKEINILTGLVDSVKAISMQSHLLSINAAIEGSRAGPSGASFRVIAGEMRKLALNSHQVAAQISQGLHRANLVVTGGIASSIADASERLEHVLAVADSIQKLQDDLAKTSSFYNSRFSVITQYSNDLSGNISEVLGHIQTQDIVSQSIDRMTAAIDQRNFLCEEAAYKFQHGNAELENLPLKLNSIFENYTLEEEKHKHSARHNTTSTGELKIELF